MSFDNPFDAERLSKASGCACGQHASQAEHDSAASSVGCASGARR